MRWLAALVGVFLVVSVLLDMVNTLIATQTSNSRWWLSRIVAVRSWRLFRSVGVRLSEGPARNRVLGSYAPFLVLLLLVIWVGQQVVGFGLLWWGLGGVDGVDGLFENVYYSGVVFFTVGFGEVVPSAAVPRIGALVEAFSGVLTTALVIGYLPALYTAFSERERKLMTLDDGTEERITPTNLVLAWAPDADVDDLVARFADWEDWVAGIIETHTTFPMLRFFRSHHEGQHWVTALGLLSDAALHCEIIRGADRRAPYWMLRRSIRLFQELTEGVDLSAYEHTPGTDSLFHDLYDALDSHGFDLYPFEEAAAHAGELRSKFGPPLEYLIDASLAPRGFWGHNIGHRRRTAGS
jgi:hypothetical protein